MMSRVPMGSNGGSISGATTDTLTIDPATGLMPHHGRAVAAALGLTGDLAKQAGKVLAKLYDAFIGTDASGNADSSKSTFISA